MHEGKHTRPIRGDFPEEEIRDIFQRQGQAGNHQKEMYEASDVFANWWQNRRRAVVEALIKEHQGCSLLDVGCAEGLYVRFLSGSRRISIGMDISMPKLIRAKSHRENPESLSYILADACCLPFKDDSFDVVICVDVIRYLRDPAEAAKEMFRVSREHVIVQSGTSGGKLFPFGLVLPRWFPRSRARVRAEFSSNPFEGALWHVPSRLLAKLNRYDGRDYRCLRVISHFSILTWFLHRVFLFKSNERLLKSLVKLADKIDHLLAETWPGKYLGVFTTVLFEKEKD